MGVSRGVLGACFIALAITASAVAEDAMEISVQDVSISVVESGGRVANELELAYPSRAPRRLRLDPTQTLKVEFKVVSQQGGEVVRPAQVFLRLTADGSGDAAYFAATKTKGGGLAVSAAPSAVQKQVGTQGGEYTAALLLGDITVATPVEWELVTLEVLHPPQDDGSQPSAESLHATAALFAPKPEITHAHRAPERRAPVLVSLLFTAATLLPLAGFLLALVRLGANAKGLPLSGPGVLWALGFHGGIAAILVLLLLFWLRLNLLQLVPWLGALGAATTLLGSKALAGAAAARKKQE